MSEENVLVLIKPDGVALELVDVVKAKLEARNLTLVKDICRTLSREKILLWRPEKCTEDYFDAYVVFLTSASVYVMLWKGSNAIEIARAMKGKARPKSGLRGVYTTSRIRNVLHTSDTNEETKFEEGIFFG